MKQIVLIILALALFSGEALASKKSDVDYVALAALLMRDGHYDRAQEALKNVDLEDKKTDFIRLYTLKGLISMKLNHFKEAIKQFEASIEAGQIDKSIYVYMAQAHFQLKQYQETITALDNAGEAGIQKASFFSLKAQSFWFLKRQSEALETLDLGLAKFAKATTLYKQAFFYLNEIGLYQQALSYGQKLVVVDSKNPSAYTLMGSALKKSKQLDLAKQVLEEGKLRFPKNTDIVVLLAHIYIEQNRVHVAADLFDQASLLDSKYIKEASELYRRAKELYRSLYFNAQISDQKEKLKQRLAILLAFGDYEMAAAMHKALKRVGLIQDEDIRYALAFTLFQSSNYKACEEQLTHLTRSDLFAKAVELRKSIQQCEQAPWECN